MHPEIPVGGEAEQAILLFFKEKKNYRSLGYLAIKNLHIAEKVTLFLGKKGRMDSLHKQIHLCLNQQFITSISASNELPQEKLIVSFSAQHDMKRYKPT